MTTLHSNYGGRNIYKDEQGRYFVEEPYLNHVGKLRHRQVGGFAEHREAREYCQANYKKWMDLHDTLDNA